MGQGFQIGTLDLRAYCDGLLKTSITYAIGIDQNDAEAMVGGSEAGSIFIPVNNFLFERDDATIMIDAGAGKIMQPTLGRLPQELASEGIAPGDVTHILLTHIHSDHTNGLLNDEGGALYPHAQILIHPDEYDFWMAPNVGGESEKILRQRHRAQLNLTPYRDQMRFVKEGEEILGCTPLLSPGHTPGHTCWRIDAGREAFLAWGDLVHFSAIQIERPDVAVTYDLDPDLARRSRLRFLDMVANERMAVAGAHVAAPGLGYVTRKGTGYSFEPA